jgi:hypothetical protein
MMQARAMAMVVAAGLVGAAGALGCGGADDPPPTTAELYGTWASDDGITTRAFTFAATSDRAELAGYADVYLLYSYPSGTAPAVVQTGTYGVEVALLNEGGGQVEDDALVTTIVFDQGGVAVGTTFGNGIQAFDGTSFELRLSGGGVRRYDAVAAPP